MKERTLQDHENARRIGKIVARIIKGNENGKKYFNVDRPHEIGFCYISAREIYSNPGNNLSERETIRALNLMVEKKEATVEIKRGYAWYRIKIKEKKDKTKSSIRNTGTTNRGLLPKTNRIHEIPRKTKNNIIIHDNIKAATADPSNGAKFLTLSSPSMLLNHHHSIKTPQAGPTKKSPTPQSSNGF